MEEKQAGRIKSKGRGVIMGLFRPTYTDKKTGERKQSAVWWYEFIYAGSESANQQRPPGKLLPQKLRKIIGAD
jgi:hypothetical protein